MIGRFGKAVASIRAEDAGVSLIETVVVMSILSVVGAIATGGVVGIFRQQRAAIAYTDAQTLAARALLKMDTEIRYAGDLKAVSGTTARSDLPDPSLVWVAVDPASATSDARCYAISLKSNALQRREWATHPSAGVVAGTQPSTLVQGIQAVTGQTPFVVSGGTETVDNDGEPVQVTHAKAVDVNLQIVPAEAAGNRVLLQRFVATNSLQGTYSVDTQCF